MNHNAKATLRNTAIVLASFVLLGAFMLIFIKLRRSGNPLDFGDIVTVLGAVIAAVAFLFGTYFALIAVSAYEHLRGIESMHGKLLGATEHIESVASSKIELINNLTVQAQSGVKHTFSQIDTLYLSFIDFLNANTPSKTDKVSIAMREHAKRMIERLYVTRARFTLVNPYCSDMEKTSQILYLQNFPSSEDIPLFEQILTNTHESEQVKEAAAAAAKRVRTNLAA